MEASNSRHATASVSVLALAAIFIIVAVLFVNYSAKGKETPNPVASTAAYSAVVDRKFDVVINPGPETPRVDSGLTHPDGSSIQVSCSTCHASRQPNPDNKATADMNEFHQSVDVVHGSITCLSCHNGDNYDQLKLADGSPVEFPNVMQLCAQCHGPQTRAFEHGAHGGMNGYWDLGRGPRARNNCVDCHPPHQPQFPKMKPTFKPLDRFLSPGNGEVKLHD